MGIKAASVTGQEAAARALARSQIYRVLAQVFRYPESENAVVAEGLADLACGPAAGHFPPALAEALSELATAMRGATPERLRERYVATFGHVTLPDCPLHETACGIGDPFQQAQTLADLAGFYRAFGLEMARDAGERGDHLAIELEFMHYLAYREAYALERHGSEQVAAIQEAQRRFLQDHLGRWAPVVARAVAARADGVLGAAARLLERFLSDEESRWGISPSPVVTDGAPPVLPPGADWVHAEEDEDLTGREL